MAAITWKNVSAPSFSASNQLLESSNRALSDAFASGADILTKEGDRRKGINTDKGIAFAAAMQGLDNFDQKKADFMASLGSNIDRGAIADRFNTRQQTLQGNQTFANNQTAFGQDTAKNELEMKKLQFENSPEQRALQDEVLQSKIGASKAAAGSSNASSRFSDYRIQAATDEAALADKQRQDQKRIEDLFSKYVNDDGTVAGTAFLSAAGQPGMNINATAAADQLNSYLSKTGATDAMKAASDAKKVELASLRTRNAAVQKAKLESIGKGSNYYKSYSSDEVREKLSNLNVNFYNLNSVAGETDRVDQLMRGYSGQVKPEDINTALDIYKSEVYNGDYQEAYNNLTSRLSNLSLKTSDNKTLMQKAFNKEEDAVKKAIKRLTGK